jgi:CheY-like chemotaxis protein
LPLSGLTVLAVDDNEIHNYALSRMLEHLHAEVRSAFTVSDALKQIREKPDVIILDVHLPDGNGFAMCRQLKRNPETKDIPVIFITATFQSYMAEQMARDAGASTIIFYPALPNHLMAAILAGIRRVNIDRD